MKSRWLLFVVPILVILVIVQLVRPVPNVEAQPLINQTITVPGQAPQIEWPSQGEAALAIDGVGSMGKYGSDTPVPIASVTKIMTAYLTLKKHPLTAGADGPALKVTSDDVTTYNQDNAQGESLVPVVAGEQLTERQALEALLLPSANNIATLLAKWDDGSEAAFVQEMNATAKQLGMTNTHYADASGFDPSSASSAVDQVKMVEAAMADPTFKAIVAMPQATLPTAGTVYNVDYVLGQDGIIGVKTGSTDQAGGCFVFAANDTVAGKPYMIVGAVLGQQGAQPLMAALNESLTLVKDAKKALVAVPVLNNQQAVANLDAPWDTSKSVQAVPDQAITFVGWPGMTIQTKLDVTNLGKQVSTHQSVGSLEIQSGSEKATVSLHSTDSISAPSYTWKLKRL